MSEMNTVEEILDFAIAKEQEAVDFYTALAGRMDRQWIKDLFSGFAEQEKKHRALIEEVKAGKEFKPKEGAVMNLKIADYLVELEVSDDMDYQSALILAMDREKAAFKLYTDLAERAEGEQHRELFMALAQEEAKHKLYLEREYDEKVLTDN